VADTRNGASISADNLLAKKIVVQVPQITTPMQNVYLVLEGRFRVNLSVTKYEILAGVIKFCGDDGKRN